MNKADRLHRTAKVIQKRKKIVKQCWYGGKEAVKQYENEGGRLRKFNLSCPCSMCREAKKEATSNHKNKRIKSITE